MRIVVFFKYIYTFLSLLPYLSISDPVIFSAVFGFVPIYLYVEVRIALKIILKFEVLNG